MSTIGELTCVEMDPHYLDLYLGYTRKGQNIGLVVVGGSNPWLNYIYIEPLGTGRSLVPPCLIPG
jgi:hypothetical protein